MVALAQPEDAVREAFAAEAAKGIDVVIDYLWGRPTELLLEALAKGFNASATRPTRLVEVGESAGKTITLARSDPAQHRSDADGQRIRLRAARQSAWRRFRRSFRWPRRADSEGRCGAGAAGRGGGGLEPDGKGPEDRLHGLTEALRNPTIYHQIYQP